MKKVRFNFVRSMVQATSVVIKVPEGYDWEDEELYFEQAEMQAHTSPNWEDTQDTYGVELEDWDDEA